MAIVDYDEALKINSYDTPAYYNRSLARRDLGNKQGAISDFQKAADLYKQQGNSEWHQNALNQLKELQP